MDKTTTPAAQTAIKPPAFLRKGERCRNCDRREGSLCAVLTCEELDRMDQEAEALMEEAIRFADDSPMPELSELYQDVYVDYPIDMMKRGVNMDA